MTLRFNSFSRHISRMLPTITFTRSQFQATCKAFIDKSCSDAYPALVASSMKGWSWNEHVSTSGLGYMSRTTLLFYQPEEDPSVDKLYVDDPELDILYDDAALIRSNGIHGTLSCRQFIVYSQSFQVPAFYFTIHDSNGSPLPLSNILKSSLFRPFAFGKTEATAFALTGTASSFPLLSQGDHPTLGTPCWYFHPCETATSVGEVMAEVEDVEWTDEQRLVRWLEAWFMILGTVVDLRV